MKDTDPIAHIFSLPNEAGSDTPTNAEPRRAKRFDLRWADGGFLLVPGKVPLANFPVRVRIEAGYAVRRGDAISRWAADDFVFTRQPLRQEPKPNGVVVSREDGNSIELEIRKPDFVFGVCGFDKKRDLVVRAIELRSDNEADV